MRRRRRPQRGSTLLEAFAALAVFSVGIVGVMQMQLIAARQNSFAARSVRGSMLARSLADAVGRHGFSQLDPCDKTAVNTLATVESALANDLRPSNLDLLKKSSTLAAADIDLDATKRPSGCLVDKTALNEAAPAVEGYRRFLVIRPYQDSATGEETALIASAVVAWREGGRLRHAIAHAIVADPSFNRSTIPGL